ncbi:hypothetical protein ACOMHN_040947 [Nucella lapillus]
MAFRPDRKSNRNVQNPFPEAQDVVSLGRGRSSSRGKAPTRAQSKTAAPPNAARTSRVTFETSGSVTGHQSMGQPRRGPSTGRGAANRTTAGGGKRTADSGNPVQPGRSSAGTRVGAGPGGQSQPSGLESWRGNASGKAGSVSVGSRNRAGRSDKGVGSLAGGSSGSYPAKGQGKPGASNISTVTRNHLESLQAAQDKRTKGSSAAGQLNAASSSSSSSSGPSGLRERSGGRHVQRQSVAQTYPSTEWVVPSLRPGRTLKRKKGEGTWADQNPSSSSSSSVLQSSKVEPSSKKTRLADSQIASVDTTQMPRGKKSLLRRAQEDMLVSSSAVTDKSNGKTTHNKSSTGVSQGENGSRLSTRRSVHNASSTRLRNCRYQGSETEIQGTHQSAERSSAAMTTQARKKAGVRFDVDYNPGNGLSPAPQKIRLGERRGADNSPGPSVTARGKSKAGCQADVGGVAGRKSRATGTQQNNRGLPMSAHFKDLSTTHSGKSKRPRRNSSKRKNELYDYDFGHSDSSTSDTELPKKEVPLMPKKIRKDEDRAWRAPIRPNRPKQKPSPSKRKKPRFGAAENKLNSSHVTPIEIITYIKYPDEAYPIKLHTASFAKELPLPGADDDSGKVGAEDSVVKDEAESKPYTLNQEAKLPGEVAYMEEDFYVEIADNDDEEDMDARAKAALDDLKQDSKNTVVSQEGEADVKADNGLHTAVSVQKEGTGSVVSSAGETQTMQLDPVSGPTSACEEVNESETAQSDSRHSHGEQSPSSTSLNTEHHRKSDGVEEKQSCLQGVEVLESEGKECSDKKGTDSGEQQDLSKTQTAQQESCRQTGHPWETIAAQTHVAPGGDVSSEEDSLSTSPPQEEPCGQASLVSAEKTGDQMLACEQGNTEQNLTVERQQTEKGIVLGRSGQTLGGTEMAKNRDETPDRVEESPEEQQEDQGGEASGADSVEDKAGPAVSDKDPDLRENGGAVSSQAANSRGGLTHLVTPDPEMACSSEKNLLTGTLLEHSSVEEKSQQAVTLGQDPVQDCSGGVDSTLLENPVQIEKVALPTHSHPDQMRDISCENKRDSEWYASSQNISQQSSNTDNGEVQPVLNVDSSEKLKDCVDFVTAKSVLQENDSLTTFKESGAQTTSFEVQTRQFVPVQESKAEEVTAYSDQTGAENVEKCCEGFHTTPAETSDKGLGKRSGVLTGPAAVETCDTPGETGATVQVDGKCLNSEEHPRFPENTNWRMKQLRHVVDVVSNVDTVLRSGQSAPVVRETVITEKSSALEQEQNRLVMDSEEGGTGVSWQAALETAGVPFQEFKPSLITPQGEQQGQNYAQKVTADSSSFSSLNSLGKTVSDENENPGPLHQDRVPC